MINKLHELLDALGKDPLKQLREDEEHRGRQQDAAMTEAKIRYEQARQKHLQDMQLDIIKQRVLQGQPLTNIPTSPAGSIFGGAMTAAPGLSRPILQMGDAAREPTINEIEGFHRIFFDQVLADPDAKTIAMLIKDKEWQAVSVLGSNGVVGINIKGQVGKWLYATTYHSYRIKISDAIAILQMAFTTLQRTEETRGYFEAVEAANVVG